MRSTPPKRAQSHSPLPMDTSMPLSNFGLNFLQQKPIKTSTQSLSAFPIGEYQQHILGVQQPIDNQSQQFHQSTSLNNLTGYGGQPPTLNGIDPPCSFAEHYSGVREAETGWTANALALLLDHRINYPLSQSQQSSSIMEASSQKQALLALLQQVISSNANFIMQNK